jgi:predicted ATPase
MALGLRETSRAGLQRFIDDELSTQSILLLLDNFEHLLPAAPVAVDLLACGPNVKILTTSRAPLRVRGEHVFPIEPLRLPSESDVSLKSLAENDAIRLFVARARAVQPAFSLSDQNAAATVAICRRLDGLPLAIELAAARINVLPPAALLSRLERRLPLLTYGSRDLPARQQTLRDTIAWSFDLLSDRGQAVFRRLAVFVGGCGLEAAEVVGDLDGTCDVFTAIISLVENSLLVQEADAEGEPRFRMLETVREFARELLESSPEPDAVHRSHGAWCLGIAEERVGDWPRVFDPDGLRQVEAEHANMRAALGWLLDRGEAAGALRLAAALWPFWYLNGHASEGWGWLARALAISQDAPAELRASALVGMSWLAEELTDYAHARTSAEEALGILTELGDIAGQARARHALGIATWDLGDTATAETLLAEAIATFRALDDRFWTAMTLNNHAVGLLPAGEFERAATMFEEALTLLRDLEIAEVKLYPLLNLGMIALARGEIGRAARLLGVGLDVAARQGSGRAAASLCNGLAAAAALAKQGEHAARLFGASQALWEGLALPVPGHDRAIYARYLAEARAITDEGTFAAAWEAGRALSFEQAITEARTVAAGLQEWQPT